MVGLDLLLAGGLGGLAGAALFRLGESRRWEHLLAPVETELADLAEKFHRHLNREAVRQRRDREGGGLESGTLPLFQSAVQKAIARQNARRVGHGAVQEDQEGG